MSFDAQRLYELLPATYRIRDAQQGEPLKALLSVLAEQVAVLEEDLDQLYDDQFIETCAEWVVPYIGDLVGARGIFSYPNATFSQRAQVANTVAYRRRKGTATVLEQLAHDVTGWNASVVEYFQCLATTQYINHLRRQNLAFTSLRNHVTIDYWTKVEYGRVTEQTITLPNWEVLEYLTTPFDATARTVDVRRIESGRGKHNIANLGIFLWRIESFPVQAAPAFRVDARRYCFDPLGRDLPLFNAVQTETEISHLATPVNVPMPLSRRALSEKLAEHYGTDDTGEDKSLLVEIGLHSPSSPVDSDGICICDLRDVRDVGGAIIGWANMPKDKVAVDPVLGRIALPEDADQVRVNYHYGFAGRLGGGTYGRAATFSTDLVKVVRVPSGKRTIKDALNEVAGTGGIVEIEDDGLYFETPEVNVAAKTTIELRAADEHRPVLFLDGEMTVRGGPESQFILNGLWIAGGTIGVPSTGQNQLERFVIKHCTLAPAATPDPRPTSPPAAPLAPVQLVIDQPNLTLEIDLSVTGPLRVHEEAEATLTDTIVVAGSSTALAYANVDGTSHGGSLSLRNCTVVGQVRTDVITLASNTIFYARAQANEPPVEAQRSQEGCVRFSYLPLSSKVPRRYHCQPEQALSDLADKLELASPAEIPPSLHNATLLRLQPVFTSLRFGDPAYGQLSQLAPVEIRQGADDETEMGVYHHLYQAQRIVNLRTRLEEYLRFGLEAGIFPAT